MKLVGEAKEATEHAQDSVAKVQAHLLLDDKVTIEHTSQESLKVSKDIEVQSKDLLEKRKEQIFIYLFIDLFETNIFVFRNGPERSPGLAEE